MSNFDMIINWILRGKNGVEDFEANCEASHRTFAFCWPPVTTEPSFLP